MGLESITAVIGVAIGASIMGAIKAARWWIDKSKKKESLNNQCSFCSSIDEELQIRSRQFDDYNNRLDKYEKHMDDIKETLGELKVDIVEGFSRVGEAVRDRIDRHEELYHLKRSSD